MKFLKEINLVNIAGNPGTPANGDIWYNTSDNKFKGYENSTIYNLVTLGYYGVSNNSLTISAGSKTFDTDLNLAYRVGQVVRLTYNASNFMEGAITAYSGTSMTVNVGYRVGSGTYATWYLSPSTEQRVPEGGDPGEIFAKVSSTSYDTDWVNVSSLTDINYNNTFLLMGS